MDQKVFIPLRDLWNSPQNIQNYQLAESHPRAIANDVNDTAVIGLVQGPLAIGKITAVAKLVNIVIKHFPPSGKVVCTAHSNEALRVVAERTIQIMDG